MKHKSPTTAELEEIANLLTDEDIKKWHEGKLTRNTRKLVKKYGAFQVWGSHTGTEPLTVRAV